MMTITIIISFAIAAICFVVGVISDGATCPRLQAVLVPTFILSIAVGAVEIGVAVYRVLDHQLQWLQ